jgi:hypothetical protein
MITRNRPRCSCCAGSGYDALAVDDDGGAVTCWACDGTGYDERMPDDWPPDYLAARAAGHAAMAAERRAFGALRATLETLEDDLQQASDALRRL